MSIALLIRSPISMLGQKNCGKEGYEIKAMNWNSKIRD